MLASGVSIRSSTALATSRRLCGGMLVAMPTAMPDEPLTSRFGHLGRQDRRLLEPVVEVGLEVDGVLVDVLQHRDRDAGEPGLGVAVGRRRVAVDRAEVPLPVHQRIAEREVLHHADERVVDRLVAVRVVLAQHVAHHGRRLLVRAAGDQAQLVHRVEDAAVHRLEAVAHVGQRPRDDDAHRVVDERLLHLFFDEPGQDPFARVGCGHVGRWLGENPAVPEGGPRPPNISRSGGRTQRWWARRKWPQGNGVKRWSDRSRPRRSDGEGPGGGMAGIPEPGPSLRSAMTELWRCASVAPHCWHGASGSGFGLSTTGR